MSARDDIVVVGGAASTSVITSPLLSRRAIVRRCCEKRRVVSVSGRGGIGGGEITRGTPEEISFFAATPQFTCCLTVSDFGGMGGLVTGGEPPLANEILISRRL